MECAPDTIDMQAKPILFLNCGYLVSGSIDNLGEVVMITYTGLPGDISYINNKMTSHQGNFITDSRATLFSLTSGIGAYIGSDIQSPGWRPSARIRYLSSKRE